MVRRLYLKVGDWVIHGQFPEWGEGRVVEERNSEVLGGLCMVRILFRDGKERSFINNCGRPQLLLLCGCSSFVSALPFCVT